MEYTSPLNHCFCIYFDGTSEIMLWDINSNRLTKKDYHSCGPDSLFSTFYHTILKDFPYRSEENISALLRIMLDRSLSWNAYNIELEHHIMKSKSLNDVLKKVQDIRLLLADNREQFWNHLVENMGAAFSPKGTIDAYLDTFTNYLVETEADKKLFGTNMEYLCGECDGIKSWCLPKITISFSSSTSISDNIMATLFQEIHVCCGREMALKETKLPKILLLTFEETGIMLDNIPETFVLFENQYDIIGAVRHKNHHFISLVKAQCGKWCILDDMKNEIEHFGSLAASIFSFQQRQGSGNGLQLVIATQRGWKKNVGHDGMDPSLSQHEASPHFSFPQRILIQPTQNDDQEVTIGIQPSPVDQTIYEVINAANKDALRKASPSTSELPKLDQTEESPNHSQRGKQKLAIEEKRKRDAERKKHARALETDEKRALRLGKNNERKKLARSKENTNEKRKRLQNDLILKQKLRATESQEKKTDRQQKNRKHMQESRASESSEKKKDRQLKNRKQMKKSRAAESLEAKKLRQLKNRKQMQELRAAESTEERNNRQQKNKNRMKLSHAAESSTKRNNRLQKNNTKTKESRQAESPKKRNKRLNNNKIRKNVYEENETVEMKTMRLSTQSAAMTRKRSKRAFEVLVSFTHEDFQHCKSCLKILLFESGTTIKSINSVSEYLSISELDRVCYSCAAAINKNNLPKLSVTNSLSVSTIPAIIKKLNILEKRHICQVQTYLTLLKLPGGQYAQKGMAIHFPADPTEHIKSLPHEPSKSGIVCVSGETLRFLRRELILAALHWLKRNNILYKDVSIAYDRLGVDEQELKNLEETIEQSGIIPMDYDHPKIPVEQFLKRKPGSSIQFARSSGKPVSVLDKKHSDALAFPWLFPTGEGDFHTPRQIKLDYLPYIQSRILHKDPRFRTDIPFLIVSTNRHETMVLSRQVNFYMRIRKTEKIKEGVNHSSISLNDIQYLNRNPDIAFNSTMFMKKTRGTPAYWKDKLWDLLAKMKMLGPPDLFLTLSCDDLGWEDLQMFLKADLQSEYKSPAQAVRSDPVAVAFFCQKKMKSMIQLIMKREEILGKISDFHVRVEFQNRGSVHFHIFLWVPAAPATSA